MNARIALEKLDEDYQKMIVHIQNQIKEMGDFLTASFDVKNNLELFSKSINVAYAFGVEEKNIIKTMNELDEFMGFDCKFIDE